jgi:hypothetical protein
MKKTLTFVMLLLAGTNIAQVEETPFEGFQASVYVGGLIGDIRANITDLNGETRMKGSRMTTRVECGYTLNNWGIGFTVGINTMSWESAVIQGETYKAPEDYTIDCPSYGIYVKRRFMPINVFVVADLGVSRFNFYDNNSELVGQSEIGFAWNVSAGKEFLIGKRKRFGLGAYLCLTGLSCHDVPPYEEDVYKFISPGMGVVFSYH